MRDNARDSKIKDIKAILLDIGGVMVDVAWYRLTEMLGIPLSKSTNHYPTEPHFGFLHNQFMRGKISADAFFYEVKHLFQLSFSIEAISEAWCTILSIQEERVLIFREFAKHVPIYIFSDTDERHFPYQSERLKFSEFTAGKVLSYENGYLKPEAGMFNSALSIVKQPPENILIIDDRADIILEGRKSGFLVHQFQSEEGLRRAAFFS